MKWLRKRVERAVDENGRGRASTEDRQALVLFATTFLGRDPEAPGYDVDVRSVVNLASRGSEAMAIERLAIAIRDHEITISLEELTTMARMARVYGVHEDRWAFVGAAVQR